MRKNYKLVLGLVAGLAVGTAMTNSVPTEAKIKYETPKQAGQRFYKAETLAYKGKKKVTRVFYYKTKDYKDIYKFTSMLYKEAAKAQYGSQFINQHMTDGSTDIVYVKDSHKIVKKGVGSYKITINGKSGTFRREYRETEANRKLLADLTPLTKGKSQFDKAWISMQWLQGRSYYQCGRNQDTSNKALWNRKYHTDCDGLAGSYSYYAKAAGVKKVGIVSTKDHSFNYIVVNDRMYFIDYQDCSNPGFGREGDLSGKEFVEKMYDPDFLMKKWQALKGLTNWYRDYVSTDVKNEFAPKILWNKMTTKQRDDYKNCIKKMDGRFDILDEYNLECDSWSQAQFLPMKVYCARYSDYTVKKIKKIVPKKLHKYLW
jgi:hypothetical protein